MKLKTTVVFLIMSISLGSIAVSQEKPDKKIQYVALKDTFLIKEIEELITHETNSNDTNQFFKKGLGYVKLHVKNYANSDTLIEYYIYASMSTFKEDVSDLLYPLFYTYVNDRIVLIYLNVVNEFASFNISGKTKRKFRKKIEPFLEKTKRAVFRDMEGNKTFTDRKFRIDWFSLHGGKYIYILKNKPPIVVEESRF